VKRLKFGTDKKSLAKTSMAEALNIWYQWQSGMSAYAWRLKNPSTLSMKRKMSHTPGCPVQLLNYGYI